MKVLYDFAIFSMQRQGGVSRVMYELINEAMQEQRVDCRVWGGFHHNVLLQELKQRYAGRTRACMIPSPLAKQRLLIPVNSRFFTRHAQRFQPDICHYTYFHTTSLPARTRVVVTVHDLINELFPDRYAPDDPQSRMRKKALQQAAGIVCVSENTKKDLVRFYKLDDKPILVAHNGNSLAAVTPAEIVRPKPFWLYVGTRRAWHKNFDVIGRALAREPDLADYELILFGGGKPTTDERARIAALNLTGRVHWCAGTDAELAGYYRAATALIAPSRYEGFGLPPLEAMSQGCPVLVSHAPPMPEIVGDAGLYFDPESADELGVCMKRVDRDAALVKDLKEKGYRRAAAFSWKESCRKIVQFYAMLLG